MRIIKPSDKNLVYLAWLKSELYRIKELSQDELNIIYNPVYDWFLDTGRTFELKNIISHLAPNRGFNLDGGINNEVIHFNQIEEISRDLKGNINDIILISSNISSGKFTIIDGTHRASVLMQRNSLTGTKIFIGTGNMENCGWSVEKRNFNKAITEFNDYVREGKLW